MQITIEEQPSKEDVDRVAGGLNEFNEKIVGPDRYRPLHIFARDEQGRIAGGLLGGIWWRQLHIDILWLEESQRGQGLGQAILAAAEEEGRRLGCVQVHLDTMSWQAPGFYQKLGYRIFGELDNFPPGFRKYFLVKEL
jgi:GNAT superfamily N-acetyltransferase